MPYYKDTENKLHFLDSSDFEYLLPSGCLLITDSEAEAIRITAIVPAPVIVPPTIAELMAKLAEIQAQIASLV